MKRLGVASAQPHEEPHTVFQADISTHRLGIITNQHQQAQCHRLWEPLLTIKTEESPFVLKRLFSQSGLSPGISNPSADWFLGTFMVSWRQTA